MKLTPENKKEIDDLTYDEMLHRWNYSTPKNLWFRGETGEYWRKRMSELEQISLKEHQLCNHYF